MFRSSEPLIKTRNFDPVSRTVKKRSDDVDMDDTVEKNVEGLAERVIAEDEERRKQELVCLEHGQYLSSWKADSR